MAASNLFCLKNALRSVVSPQNHPLIRRIPLRYLSTEGEAPQDATEDAFLRTPDESLVFAKLTGNGKNTLKTDIIHFFEGCNLSTTDIKVEYNKLYYQVGMLVQFPSRSSFEMALRQTARKGRLYKLERVNRTHWDLTKSYDGKAVLLQGIPRNAFQEDIERFLSGCNFDPSSFSTFLRAGFPDPERVTLVHFPTHIDAMNTYCWKNRSFCLNNPITVRVLQ